MLVRVRPFFLRWLLCRSRMQKSHATDQKVHAPNEQSEPGTICKRIKYVRYDRDNIQQSNDPYMETGVRYLRGTFTLYFITGKYSLRTIEHNPAWRAEPKSTEKVYGVSPSLGGRFVSNSNTNGFLLIENILRLSIRPVRSLFNILSTDGCSISPRGLFQAVGMLAVQVKVVLIGDTGVGKTTLAGPFCGTPTTGQMIPRSCVHSGGRPSRLRVSLLSF
jgi:hypothetical protein